VIGIAIVVLWFVLEWFMPTRGRRRHGARDEAFARGYVPMQAGNCMERTWARDQRLDQD